MRVSYAERGAKDNSHVESLWGRLKTEIGSRIDEAATLAELEAVLADRFCYYNRKRRHSGVGNEPPLTYLNSILTNDEPGRELAAVA